MRPGCRGRASSAGLATRRPLGWLSVRAAMTAAVKAEGRQGTVTCLVPEQTEGQRAAECRHRDVRPGGRGRDRPAVRPTRCRRPTPPGRPKAREVQAPRPSRSLRPAPRTPTQSGCGVRSPLGTLTKTAPLHRQQHAEFVATELLEAVERKWRPRPWGRLRHGRSCSLSRLRLARYSAELVPALHLHDFHQRSHQREVPVEVRDASQATQEIPGVLGD